MNTVTNVKTAKNGIDVEIQGAKEFLHGGDPYVLRVGSEESQIYRYADNGDLSTLIFTFTTKQYQKTKTGDPVTLRNGRDPSRPQESFGRFDKSARDK